MSLRKFLKQSKPKEDMLLPKPTSSEVACANAAVMKAMDSSSSSSSKRGSYKVYTKEVRANIGHYAVLHGNKAAVLKFSKECGHNVPESTVRGMKTAFLKEMKKTNDPSTIRELPHKPKGRPLKLGDSYDMKVQNYIRNLRLAGGIVNRSIVVAAAMGILEHLDPSCLQKHGGSITIDSAWAKSLLGRMGYVKRKGTKAARKLPEDFEAIKTSFLERIKEVATFNGCWVPPQLIINKC